MSASLAVSCVVALGALQLVLMIHMSLMRVSKVKGAGVRNSYFENVHNVQLLASEYTGILSVLMLYIHFQAQATNQELGLFTQYVMMIVVFGRYCVAARVWAGPLAFPCSFVGTLCSYVCFASLLVLATKY